MKTAKDYPVSLEYNATSWPYSRLKKHKGRDYAAPSGTPVKVLNTVVARVGNSGWSTGPHAHMVKYVSKVVNFLGFPRFYKDPEDVWRTGGRVVFSGWLGTAGWTVIWKEVRTDGKRVFRGVMHCQRSGRLKKNEWVR